MYLWPLSNRGYSWAISVSGSHGTSLGTNISSLDRLYKNHATMDTQYSTCSGLQLAKQLDSREDIVRVIVTEVVDSAFSFLPSQVLRETANKLQTNEFLGLWIT